MKSPCNIKCLNILKMLKNLNENLNNVTNVIKNR